MTVKGSWSRVKNKRAFDRTYQRIFGRGKKRRVRK